MLSLICSFIRFRVFRQVVAFAGSMARIVFASDARYIRFIRCAFMRGTPRADAALDHYCRGGGAPLTIPAGELFEEDQGFASYISRTVSEAMRSSASAGTVDVPQWRLSNIDWRLALGSFQLCWRAEGNGIAARINGEYDWHPEEIRMTKSVHEAAASLKNQAARAFPFHSNREFVPIDLLKRNAEKVFVPRDRVYM